MITLPRVLLFVGVMCLALAGWSLIQGDTDDALRGLGLGALLLLFWRWEKSAIKLIYLNVQPWTRREVFVWLSALIVAVCFGVLFLTNVLGSWALLVAPILALGVGSMRYRNEVKRNAQRVAHGADRSEA